MSDSSSLRELEEGVVPFTVASPFRSSIPALAVALLSAAAASNGDRSGLSSLSSVVETSVVLVDCSIFLFVPCDAQGFDLSRLVFLKSPCSTARR